MTSSPTSDLQSQSEKGLNLLRWVDFIGTLFIAVMMYVFFKDLVEAMYIIVIALVASALISFFWFFPWLIKRQRK